MRDHQGYRLNFEHFLKIQNFMKKLKKADFKCFLGNGKEIERNGQKFQITWLRRVKFS